VRCSRRTRPDTLVLTFKKALPDELNRAGFGKDSSEIATCVVADTVRRYRVTCQSPPSATFVLSRNLSTKGGDPVGLAAPAKSMDGIADPENT
jgi:hypothetical protein